MSDLVTLPSFYREGIPRVLLEAMALRKPIVTTNNVGCKEVVDEGVNGYLVPTKNALALANSIRKILDDDQLSRAMGRASRRKVEREFDEQLVISKVLDELYGLPSIKMAVKQAA
jgi:glycosyltransferase involved in cell wall biosynthesis